VVRGAALRRVVDSRLERREEVRVVTSTSEGDVGMSTGRKQLWVQGLVALLMLLPVTLPVPVLRSLVHDRFEVSETLTSLFMSINMLGAALAAPLVGLLADRIGQRKRLILIALVVDALCFLGLTLPVSFFVFMSLRFIEGCAHITALSMLLSLASTSVGSDRRGRAFGIVGAGLLLGVALGAPLGGYLGANDPLRPLQVGGLVVLLAALLCAVGVRDDAVRPIDAERSDGALASIRLRGRLLIPLLFAFADRFTVGFYTTTFSLYLSRVHDFDPPRIGMLITCFMLPFALLSYPFGWLSERTSRVMLLGVGSLVYGLGTASLVAWSPAALPFVMAAIGIAAAVMFVPTMLLTTEMVDESMRSTALGAFNAAGSLGFIIGPLVGGLVSETVAASSGWEAGYRVAFQVAGGSEVLLVCLALPFLRRIGRGG
jgi:MFS family permease